MFVVVTHPAENDLFSEELIKLGLEVFLYPTIKFEKSILNPENQELLKNLNQFDWVIFTSQNGVKFFIEIAKEMGIDFNLLQKTKVAAVGSQTAKELEKNQIKVDFYPSDFNTLNLAENLQIKSGGKVLLLRTNIANSNFIKQLTKKGALVTNIPIYKTIINHKNNPELENLLSEKQVKFLTFTSPSTARGLLDGLSTVEIRTMVLNCPVISIGPTTTQFLQKSGFKTIYTAKIHTLDGMLKKITEVI